MTFRRNYVIAIFRARKSQGAKPLRFGAKRLGAKRKNDRVPTAQVRVVQEAINFRKKAYLMLRKTLITANSIARNWQNYLFLISSYSWSCMGHSSSAPMANAPIIEPKGKHTATVIFLHGLGDTGHGWCEGFRSIKQDHIKYIFPNANTMPVTLNGNFRMPSWFDLYTLEPGGKEDEAGIKKASDQLLSMIDEEEQKHSIKLDRICIGGFSQGGAVALHAGLMSGRKIGGIIALSSWLPSHKKVLESIGGSKSDVHIFQAHGNSDPVVPYEFGKMTAKVVGEVCPNHEFKTYSNLGHSSNPQEVMDVATFISKRLPPV
ncbi:acyl-protein thioesterase 1-like [Lineus longissimus]|uniref:acyl-protein thioesterase 1-like n=1 Tax=Lineus longissimus TaxID=88925 RepID=UPI00315D41E0